METQKQISVLSAMRSSPLKQGESKSAYARRIAASSGASPGYVRYLLMLEDCARAGAASRAQMPPPAPVPPTPPDIARQFAGMATCLLHLPDVRNDPRTRAYLNEVLQLSNHP